MTNLIADKRIGRTKAGGKLRVQAHEARALIALGWAHLEPKPKPKAEIRPETLTLPRKGQYARRDMVAETFAAPVESKLEPRRFIGQGHAGLDDEQA